MHNGRFDFTTGEAKGAPACVNLATYPVKVEGGRLFVKLELRSIARALAAALRDASAAARPARSQAEGGDAMKLSGVAAIVTGGGSGLGRATAEALAAKGAKVDGVRPQHRGGGRGGQGDPRPRGRGDVADEASAGAAIAKAAAAHGPARVLVNCAGIGIAKRVVGRDGPHPLADFEKVIRVNLIGTFNMIRLAAAAMGKLEPIEGERGVIISTASIAAYDGQIGQAAYSASKGGVVAMTLPIARELAQFGVRVNAIAPGVFMTPMMFGLPQAAQDSLGASVPFPARLGQPAEYAALAVHIVENGYINGETIRIDGALRMAPK